MQQNQAVILDSVQLANTRGLRSTDFWDFLGGKRKASVARWTTFTTHRQELSQQTARNSHHPLTWHELLHVCSVAGCRANQSTNKSAQERPGRNRNLAASGSEERPDPRPLSQRVRGPGHTAGAAAEKLLARRGNGIILIITVWLKSIVTCDFRWFLNASYGHRQ